VRLVGQWQVTLVCCGSWCCSSSCVPETLGSPAGGCLVDWARRQLALGRAAAGDSGVLWRPKFAAVARWRHWTPLQMGGMLGGWVLRLELLPYVWPNRHLLLCSALCCLHCAAPCRRSS
jgi:hypothetical protein